MQDARQSIRSYLTHFTQSGDLRLGSFTSESSKIKQIAICNRLSKYSPLCLSITKNYEDDNEMR